MSKIYVQIVKYVHIDYKLDPSDYYTIMRLISSVAATFLIIIKRLN